MLSSKGWAELRWPCRCSTPWAPKSPSRFPAASARCTPPTACRCRKTEHGIDEWSWFPTAEKQRRVRLRQVDRAAQPRSASSSASWAGCYHPSGPKADPHVCSDMWLTGAPLHNPKPGTYNSVGLDQVVALHTKQYCRQPSLVLSIDAGTGFLSRTGTISYSLEGRPIPGGEQPAPRVRPPVPRRPRVAASPSATSCSGASSWWTPSPRARESLDQQLGKSDRERMDQYLTSLNEVESRLIASEKWIDVPLKKQDYSHLNLDATSEGEPAEYYRNMFDLIALAFDADITRSVAFMLNREDGMGISDTFPIKLGLVENAPQSVARRGQGRATGSSPSTTCSSASSWRTSSSG